MRTLFPTASAPLLARGLFCGLAIFLIPNAMAQDESGLTPQQVESLFESSEYSADGGVLPYRILSPPQVVASKTYPLVLFLHGAGERGEDNRRQLVHAAADFARADRRQAYPAFVVFPQCAIGHQWVDVPWSAESGRGTFPDQPSKHLALALQLVKKLKTELPVDPARIYVTGLSMGGYGTWHAAALENTLFAAAAPVCGGSDPLWADRYQGIPIWAFHGSVDKAVPVERSREMVAALADSGHAPEIRYVEYPGVGHNSWTRSYQRDDFFRWLFSQRRP